MNAAWHSDISVHLKEMIQKPPVRVIAVSAGKGGVGKSTLSINLAIALGALNYSVMLLDADLGLANIDIMLGLEVKRNLLHVIQGDCSLRDVIMKGPHNIQIVPAVSGSDKMASLSVQEYAGIVNAFNELSEPLDYLIIDTASGISETVLSFIRSSQEVIVVVCDEPASLMDAYALIKTLHQRFAKDQFHVLINMVRKLEDGIRLFQHLCDVTEQYLNVSLNCLGMIPFDDAVHEAIKHQEAVVLKNPHCRASMAMVWGAKKLSNFNSPCFDGSNTSFFLKRLFPNENKGAYGG